MGQYDDMYNNRGKWCPKNGSELEMELLLCRFVDVFFFQAEDGIRDAQESRGLGDVYKRQGINLVLKRPSA